VTEDCESVALGGELDDDRSGAVRVAGLTRPEDFFNGRRELWNRLKITVGFGTGQAGFEDPVIHL
jgi:hypothetical protein